MFRRYVEGSSGWLSTFLLTLRGIVQDLLANLVSEYQIQMDRLLLNVVV